MKWVLRIGIGLVILIAVLVVVSNLWLGGAVTSAVNRLGPGALGVPVELDSASVRLLQGKVDLAGLRVGNPEGFRTDHAFELGALSISLNPRSVLSDEILIHHIHITDPVITYERTLTGSNLDAIQKGLEKSEQDVEEPAEDDAEVEVETAEGKKVIIEDIQIRGSQVNVSLPGMVGASIPLPLPPITMTDIGKDKGGASPIEVLNRVIGAILGGVVDLVASSANLLGSGVQAVGEGAIRGAEAVGDGAVRGVEAVGGAAVGSVKAVGEGAGRVVGGVTGLFSGSDDEAEDAAEETDESADQ